MVLIAAIPLAAGAQAGPGRVFDVRHIGRHLGPHRNL